MLLALDPLQLMHWYKETLAAGDLFPVDTPSLSTRPTGPRVKLLESVRPASFCPFVFFAGQLAPTPKGLQNPRSWAAHVG